MSPIFSQSAQAKLLSAVLFSVGLVPFSVGAEEKPASLPVVALGDAISIQEYSISQTLHAWAKNSSALQPIHDVKRREIERQLKSIHTGHQISLIVALSGPLKAKTLEENFHWTQDHTAGNKTVLIAAPKEKLEHLFNGKIRIELDRDFLPASVSFTGSKPVTSSSEIQLTAYRQLTPVRWPRPGSIRTASFTLEAPAPVDNAEEEPRRLATPETSKPVE